MKKITIITVTKKAVEELEVGDVVRLKSGGPEMTVNTTYNDGDTGCWCKYFDNHGECVQKHFDKRSLKLVK